MGTVLRAPDDYPMGQEGDVLTVEFTVMGIPCIGLNGGPLFPQSEACSFQVATDDQAETDRYWDAIIGNGGQASRRGAGETLASPCQYRYDSANSLRVRPGG